ncbi:MAG: glucose 1-dehydrogenase [Candidatus Jordarchaeum sp.]|uniref:glucose 1-dehydrogenase n=1 Tax=Candidatus Jordarchaeum sp. TaxID=2823881 RepID=UPI0040494AA2
MHVMDLFRLNGKVAIVTGGGSGIGRAITEGLVEAGANVVIASRKFETLKKVSEELSNQETRVLPVKCDLEKMEEINNLVKTTLEEFNDIHILVNNSGMTWGMSSLEYSEEKWDQIMRINLKAAFFLSQKVANYWVKNNKKGKILNISSTAGMGGIPEEFMPVPAYSASKAGLITLTKDLAVKWAKYGINVNAILPGFFRTRMTEFTFKKGLEKFVYSGIPLRREGNPDEIKAAALLLVSQASDYITGAILPVDGGMLAMVMNISFT